jgi:hypothetical protein
MIAMLKKLPIILLLVFVSISNSFSQRNVLIEQFTNSGCTPCAGNTPIVASYVNANSADVIMLAYHSSFPYQDSMYYENAVQNNQRVAYYNITGVPFSKVDGNYFSGNLVPTIANTISTRLQVAPKYYISFTNTSLNGNAVSATVTLTSLNQSNVADNLVVQVVVVEKNVLKSAYLASPGNNSETEYPWVVRRMLPDANGTSLINKALNGVDVVNVNWTATNFKNLAEMRLVAFVQNVTTKEVYQAEIINPNITTGLSTVKSESNFAIYPNPAKSDLTIELNNELNDAYVEIYNQIGNLVYKAKLNSNKEQINVDVFANGIYFVTLHNQMSKYSKRIVVAK